LILKRILKEFGKRKVFEKNNRQHRKYQKKWLKKQLLNIKRRWIY